MHRAPPAAAAVCAVSTEYRAVIHIDSGDPATHAASPRARYLITHEGGEMELPAGTALRKLSPCSRDLRSAARRPISSIPSAQTPPRTDPISTEGGTRRRRGGGVSSGVTSTRTAKKVDAASREDSTSDNLVSMRVTAWQGGGVRGGRGRGRGARGEGRGARRKVRGRGQRASLVRAGLELDADVGEGGVLKAATVGLEPAAGRGGGAPRVAPRGADPRPGGDGAARGIEEGVATRLRRDGRLEGDEHAGLALNGA